MKDSNWRAFGQWMTTKDWTAVLQKTTCKDKFQPFLSELKEGIDFYLPEKTVIIHQNDKPWMTKELKSMIKKGKQPLANMTKIRDSIRGREIKSRKRSKALRLLIISTRYET